MTSDEPVEVTVKHLSAGPDGPGWYAWESECPEEGFFYVGDQRPTGEQLKSISQNYVEKTDVDA